MKIKYFDLKKFYACFLFFGVAIGFAVLEDIFNHPVFMNLSAFGFLSFFAFAFLCICADISVWINKKMRRRI